MRRVYAGVTVKCGKVDSMVIEDAVCDTLKARFPSFEDDGGGTMLGSNHRDVFFYIEPRSVKKAIKHLKSNGFKLV